MVKFPVLKLLNEGDGKRVSEFFAFRSFYTGNNNTNDLQDAQEDQNRDAYYYKAQRNHKYHIQKN